MEEVLKTTALVYLQQALNDQAYEECQGLISRAKKLGASQSEIQDVIASALRGDKPKGQTEGKLIKNRLRLLKEIQ